MKEASKIAASDDAVALAFLAGVVYNNSSSMNELRPKIRQGTLFSPGRKPKIEEWNEIISCAVERHEKITPTELLDIFGGKITYDRTTGARLLKFDCQNWSLWDFRPKILPAIEWNQFQRIVSKAKERVL